MRLKWGNGKHIHEGELYRSTNSKFIQIIEVTDTHFTYFIVKSNRKNGRPYSHLAGNYHTVTRVVISNYIGPIDREEVLDD